MFFPRIQAIVSGPVAQVFAGLIQSIRTKIEVFTARNRTGVALPKGSVVTLYNNGANLARAVRLAQHPGDVDYCGVLEQTIPNNGEGICRFDNVVDVRIVGGDANVIVGNYVYLSTTPGLAVYVGAPNPDDVIVGEIVDVSDYSAQAVETTVKVLLRYCCATSLA